MRGGKRPGSGQPLKWGEPTATVSFRVPPWLAEKMTAFYDRELNGFIARKAIESKSRPPVYGSADPIAAEVADALDRESFE